MAQHSPPRPLTANQQRAMAIEANPAFWRTVPVQGIVDRLIEAVQIQDVLLVVHGLQQLKKAFRSSADVFRFGLARRRESMKRWVERARVQADFIRHSLRPQTRPNRSPPFRLSSTFPKATLEPSSFASCSSMLETRQSGRLSEKRLVTKTPGQRPLWTNSPAQTQRRARKCVSSLVALPARSVRSHRACPRSIVGTPLFLLSIDLRSVAVFVDKNFATSSAPLAVCATGEEAVPKSAPAKRSPLAVNEAAGGQSKRQCLEKAQEIGRKLVQGASGSGARGSIEIIASHGTPDIIETRRDRSNSVARFRDASRPVRK